MNVFTRLSQWLGDGPEQDREESFAKAAIDDQKAVVKAHRELDRHQRVVAAFAEIDTVMVARSHRNLKGSK